MPTVQLLDRATILASGPDAESLLQNVITPDLSDLASSEARPGALLTPQGKILFDFLISRAGDEALRLECRRDIAQEFLKRLMLYKLRAKVELSVEETNVTLSWDEDAQDAADVADAVLDQRFPEEAKVLRKYGDDGAAAAGAVQEWERLRIAHGVAESGKDYELGDAFPHDILFDQNGGVGLRKGCFVGQEVVSRMQHRGTARRRLLILRGEGLLPETGTAVTAGGRPLGKLGTVCEADGLAILRIDRASEAMESGTPILAGDVPVRVETPAFASFALSGNQGEKSE